MKEHSILVIFISLTLPFIARGADDTQPQTLAEFAPYACRLNQHIEESLDTLHHDVPWIIGAVPSSIFVLAHEVTAGYLNVQRRRLSQSSRKQSHPQEIEMDTRRAKM
jgi:hypothetical protein